VADYSARLDNLERMVHNILRDVRQRHSKLDIDWVYNQSAGKSGTYIQFKVRYKDSSDHKLAQAAVRMIKRELEKLNIGRPAVQRLKVGSDIFVLVDKPMIMRTPMLAHTIAQLVEAGHQDLADQLLDVATAKKLLIKGNVRTKINNEIHKLINNKYFPKIPLSAIFDIMGKQGVVAIQEDNTEWSGMLLGREGKLHVELADASQYAEVGNKRVYNTVYENMLILTWYKMDSGNYEVVAYVS
jgi:hypothetical protein